MMDNTPYTTAVKIGFESQAVILPISQIVRLKKLQPGVKDSRKYSQILGSIRVVGLVEAPVVSVNSKKDGEYFLLDGHLRVEALLDLGITSVECVVSTDDDTYTYNKRINRIAAVQEHRMIKRAIDRGVPEERIAEALGLELGSVRRRSKMLNGISSEAIEYLKDTHCPMIVFDTLKRMAPIRQIEAAELMMGQNNFSGVFVKALLAATPEKMLVHTRKSKQGNTNSITSEQISRMERELASLQIQVKSVEETYGIDNLHLTVARGYIRRLLSNTSVTRWLFKYRHEYLTEFQSIAEFENINAAKAAE
jgi:hypothetical protein